MSKRAALDLLTILQTATEIADQHGLEEVTLASLAKKLGIRSPSLYNHVDGLPGLRRELTLYGLNQLNGVITQAAVGRSGDEAIRTMAKAYVTFARLHPGLYTATLSAPDPNDPELQRVAGEIVQLTVQVMEYYGLEEDEALHVVRVFRSLLHGFASLEQANGFGLPLDIDTTLHVLIETLLAGIHAIQKSEMQLSNLTES
ncbi:TetR/AcrR family transcriptional regulator [Rubeoparvulum massiliense]|uniref:TetR/AcrR family transcriptional regulator n=1 Tax=Rubeoparvulum massiliense TaxID=1631346 RepID=UPI00065E12E8|nr:TetR-like C-terminal domain-containing protein [Rubeoparvulum massiliense]